MIIFASFIVQYSTFAQHTTDSMAAVPSDIGNQDVFGAYDIDPNWPINLTEIEGHDAWTFGAGQSIFAESSDRIFEIGRAHV